MGMAILPISRHSALGSFFKISVATSLAFHMVAAYTLFTLVSIHGLLYVSWIPVFDSLSEKMRKVYPVLNPTYLYHEAWPGNRSSLGIWRASLIFTGLATSFIMLLIFITTLPIIRKRHFNIFYFLHLLSIPAIIIICLHASTMFYCTSPGIMMWVLDWLMRLYELWVPLRGQIKCLGKGWYCLSVPIQRRRLDGCACTSPLAHFFIHHADSSLRELHPFTTTTHLATQNNITHHREDDINIQFLFRKRGGSAPIPSSARLADTGVSQRFSGILKRLRRQKSQAQWTNRLASCADKLQSSQSSETTLVDDDGVLQRTEIHSGVPVSLRLEGPYFTIATPALYNTVVCIVAGTGVSGALAIAGAFKELERTSALSESEKQDCVACGSGLILGSRCTVAPTNSRKGPLISTGGPRIWTRCIILWSVREDIFIELPELQSESPNIFSRT